MKEIRLAFRMVHIDNIRHIVDNGFVHKESPYASPNYVPIGDTTVIASRAQHYFQNIKLSDCIPFYFGPRSPMLYVIQHGYNGVRQFNAEEIVYCAVSLNELYESEIDCFFSDGHALNRMTTFYPKADLKRINEIIKYDDVFTKYWNDKTPFDDSKRRKEAELLVRDEMPPSFIKGFIVYNDKAKETLIDVGISRDKVIVKENFYY